MKALLLFFILITSLFAEGCNIPQAQEYYGVNDQPIAQPRKARQKAQKVGFITFYPYEEGMEKARRERVPAMVIVASAGCPHWNTLAELLIRESQTNYILDRRFVVILINSEEISLYPDFMTDVSPTMFFLDYKGDFIAAPMKGAPISDIGFSEWLFGLSMHENTKL